MSRPLDDSKRQRIVDAAVDCFAADGYTQSAIKTIAQRAGLAPGSVYTYFNDKEQLFEACVDAVWVRFFGQMEQIMTGQDALDLKLSRLIDHAMALIAQVAPLVRAMYGHSAMLGLIRLRLQQFEALFMEWLARSGYGQRPGDVAADHTRALLKILVAGALFNLGTVEPEQLDAEIAEQSACFHRMIQQGRVHEA
jgi:AcrR family transcriptional regulator